MLPQESRNKPDAPKEAGSAEGPALIRELPSDERNLLVQRVAASAAFGKSNRLRELLIFLCHRKLTDPGGAVHEQEIGVEVFGRRRDYDTTQDAIVRVQVSQLRKRLEQYFASEGKDEALVIEIPKGSYTPVFHTRDAEGGPDRPPESAGPAKVPAGRRVAILSLLAVAVILVAGGLFGPWGLRSAARPAREVDRLWFQMFDNGRPTCIVVSDAIIGLFEDAVQHQLSLNEYRDKAFERLMNERMRDPAERNRWKDLNGSYFTHLSDGRLAAAFSVLNAGRSLPTEIMFARDFTVTYLQSHNLILVGTRRTNPWVELFEDQLNFRSGFVEGPPMVSYFDNRSPQAGESARYAGQWTSQGYCRVAFLPTPNRAGSVLLISGTDMPSSEAGGQFVSTERWIRDLSSVLGVSRNAKFPYFEVLLKVDYMTWNTLKFELIAHRTHTF